MRLTDRQPMFSLLRSVALVVTLLAHALPVQAQDRATTGLFLVMDYSGSMWARAHPTRRARSDASSHFSFEDKSEIYIESLLKGRLQNGFTGTTRLTTFGENRTGDCGDITRQRIGDRLNPQMIRTVQALFRRIRPKGTTPLEESLLQAIEDSAELVLEGKADVMQIVAVTDMKDICRGGRRVANPSEEDLCNIGRTLQAALARQNLIISQRRQIENAVGIEFFVAINPVNNSGSNRPLQDIISCMDPVTQPVVLTPGVDEMPPPDLIEPDLPAPPFVQERPPEPTPPEIVSPAPLVLDDPEQAPAPQPPALTLVGRPKSVQDSFGRSIPLMPGQLIVTNRSNGQVFRTDWPVDGAELSEIRGTELDIEALPGQGKVPPLSHRFEDDARLILDLRLPRISLVLLAPNGQPVLGPVRWTLEDLGSSVQALKTTSAGPRTTYNLPRGEYRVTAALSEGPTTALDLSVSREDLDGLTLRQTAPPQPARRRTQDVAIKVQRGPVEVALGSAPAVDLLIESADGKRRATEQVGQVSLRADEVHTITAQSNNQPVLSQKITLQDGVAPPAVYVSLAPARLIATDREGGIWILRRIDGGGERELSGQKVDITLHPGRYDLSVGGRSICPAGQTLQLDYGTVAALGDSGAWPQTERCK